MFSSVSLPLAKFTAAIAAFTFNAITAQHDQKPFRVDTGSTFLNHGQAITPALSLYAEALLRNYSAPGLSVGVVHLQDETPIFEFGAWGNRTENGDHVTPESLFEIGSTSKAFLATSLGILMDDFANGRNITSLPPNLDIFNWKTKVKDILPGEWKLLDNWANEKASIKDILNHVSGLPRHDLSYEAGESPTDVVRRLRYLKPTRELREEWQYNNQMYVVGAYIVEKYAGQPYPAFVKSRIFSPLNMTSSTFSGTEAEATGHLCHAFVGTYDPNGNGTDGSPKRRIPFWFSDEDQEGLLAGAGGIVSNTIDMTKWLTTLLNKGIEPNTKTRIIPQDTFEQTTAAHVVVPSISMSDSGLFLPVAGYGMGWLRYTDNGRELVTHNGGLPGFLASVGFLPNEGLGFVSFINSDAIYVNDAITKAIVKNVFDPEAANNIDTIPEPIAAKARHAQTKTTSMSLGLSIDSYAGTYSNPGYGSFTLCTASSNSTYCREVFSNFTTVFPNEHPGTQSLYAAWRRIWISHFVLSPSSSLLSSEAPPRPDTSNKHSFSLQAWSLFPEGYGKNKASFATVAASPLPISAAFVVEDGVNGDTAGSAPKPKVKGLAVPEGFEVPVTSNFIPDERLKEDSLVYFERIED